MASGEDIHVDLSSVWVGGRLLHGLLDQSDGFIQVLLFNFIGKSHFGDGFRNSDHGLKLTRGGSNGLSGVSKTSHINILLHEVTLHRLGNLWLIVLPRIRNILGKKLSINFVRSQEFSSLHIITLHQGLLANCEVGIEGYNMVCQPPVTCLVLLVEHQIDEVES